MNETPIDPNQPQTSPNNPTVPTPVAPSETQTPVAQDPAAPVVDTAQQTPATQSTPKQPSASHKTLLIIILILVIIAAGVVYYFLFMNNGFTSK